jgi:hypothetical protein
MDIDLGLREFGEVIGGYARMRLRSGPGSP